MQKQLIFNEKMQNYLYILHQSPFNPISGIESIAWNNLFFAGGVSSGSFINVSINK